MLTTVSIILTMLGFIFAASSGGLVEKGDPVGAGIGVLIATLLHVAALMVLP